MDPDERSRLSATALPEIVTRYAGRGDRHPSEDFKALFDKCFREAQCCDQLRFFHSQAVRSAMQTGSIDWVHYILKMDPTQSVLGDKADSLQVALCAQGQPSDGKTDPTDMVRLVLQYGAHVNGIDEEGNTPIYYAVLLGLPHTFKLLLETGADLTTKHKLPTGRKSNYNSQSPGHWAEIQVPPQAPVDLMTIALHAMDHSGVYKNWAPIVLTFIDLRFNPCFSETIFAGLTKFASSTGDLEAMSKYLHHQARLGNSGCDRVSGWPAVALALSLKSATEKGHVDIVKLLLLYGADPRIVCPDRWSKGRQGPRVHFCPQGEGNYTNWQTAIAAVCDTDPKCRAQPKSTGILDACELLFWKGVSRADQRRLLTEASLQGRTDIVGRLWTAGVLVQQTPLTSSVAILDFFELQRARFNWVELQSHAIRSLKLDALEWLVERAGPCLRSEGDLEELLKDMFYHNGRTPSSDTINLQTPMVFYLCTNYAPPDLVGTELHAEVGKMILGPAIYRLIHLKTLLLAGIESGCPAIKQAAFLEMQKNSTLDKRSRLTSLDDVEYRIKALQLLYSCYNGILSVKSQESVADKDRLWLTPTMLEAKVDNYALIRLGPCANSLSHAACKPPAVLRLVPPVPPTTSGPQTPALSSPSHDELPCTLDDIVTENETNVPGTTAETWDLAHQTLPSLGIEIGSVMSVYQKLDSAFMTRLLVVEPAEDLHAPMRCTLTTVHLADKPRYDALSYVWGNDTNQAAVHVNGISWLVRKNLKAALKRLRFRRHSRTLWIDALCINQQDVEERNRHIRIMSLIYQSAKHVLIWVGESADNSELMFDHLRKLRKQSSSDPYFDEPDGEGLEQMPHNVTYHYQYGALSYLNAELRKAFERFCARPWFSRTWTIQEFALSKNAILVCGKDKEEWNLARQIYPTSSFLTLGMLRDSEDVEPILEHSMRCMATDPRDKVYALLSLLGYYSIKVDYRLTVEEVYTSFSRALFERARSIDMLHKFGLERKLAELPSWALDLSVPNLFGKLPKRCLKRWPDNASKSVRRVLDGFKIQDSAMFIKGSRLDQIHEVGQTLSPPRHPDGPPRRLAEVRKVFHDWEHCASRIPQRKFLAQVPAAFLTTLKAHDNLRNRWREPIKYHYDFPGWYHSMGSGVFKTAFPGYFRDFELVLSWDEKFNGPSSPVSFGEGSLPEEMECCYGRCFFTTKGGTMGLCNPRARPGDLVVFLSGGVYPFTLRERGDGSFEMTGDCYLYDFDESAWTFEQVREFEEFKIT